MTKIAALGEVMIELSPAGTANNRELKSLSYAGDTYNTAITLARLGLDTAYITRIGSDTYSDQVMQQLQSEGLDTTPISRSDSVTLGLYMIHNRPDGEREFAYWRSQSAARELFEHEAGTADIAHYLSDCDWLYFSAISLAILKPQARERFFTLLGNFRRQGGKVAYDSNYRPRLWASAEEARQNSLRALEHTDIALLTLDDEALLWGTEGDALAEARHRYAALNLNEVVYKRGAEDVIILGANGEFSVPVKRIENILDTTAAGDTFNAGYLACRLQGGSPVEAAQEGNRCAGAIIQHRGAIIDKDIFFQTRDGLSD